LLHFTSFIDYPVSSLIVKRPVRAKRLIRVLDSAVISTRSMARCGRLPGAGVAGRIKVFIVIGARTSALRATARVTICL
jgi:hypothetical protein